MFTAAILGWLWVAGCADDSSLEPPESQSQAWSGCDVPTESNSACAAAIQWHQAQSSAVYRTPDGRDVPVVLLCADVDVRPRRVSRVWVTPQEIEARHEQYRVDGRVFSSLDALLNYLGEDRNRLISRFAQVYVRNIGALWPLRLRVGNSLGLDARVEPIASHSSSAERDQPTLSRQGEFVMIPPGAEGLIEFQNRNRGIVLGEYHTLTVDEVNSKASGSLTVHYFEPVPAL
jgi:hypothetical protein